MYLGNNSEVRISLNCLKVQDVKTVTSVYSIVSANISLQGFGLNKVFVEE